MGLSLVRRYCIALALGAGFAGLFPAQAAAQTHSASTSKPPVVLVVGDSLSAEYGLKRGTGWVALLEQRFAKEKVTARVINASISGDTTSGGRARLPALIAQHKPAVVVIELGGNDALRGLPLAMTQDNLQTMTSAAQAAGARVLLAGMQVPPNYGEDYNRQFAAAFSTTAKTHKAALVPFLLQGVSDSQFQPDRIHPTESAHPIILNNVWPALRKLLP